MPLGKRLRSIRENRGFTQQQLAERIGISKRQYRRIEDETSSPKSRHLEKLAAVLGVKVRDLFTSAPEFATEGSAAKQAQVLAENFAFVSKLLSAPPDYQYLVSALLEDDPDLLDRLTPKFVEKLQRLLSSL